MSCKEKVMNFSYEVLGLEAEKNMIVDTSQYHYLFVINGNGSIKDDENEYTFEAGELLECPQNQKIQIHSNKSISFGKLILNELISSNNKLRKYSSNQASMAFRTFMYGLEVSGITHPFKNRIMESMNQIMADMIFSIPHTAEHSPVIYGLINRINDNYTNPDFNIGDALVDEQFSPAYIRRKFYESASITPVEFLNNLRLEHAKKLLMSNVSLSVKEVAEESGFRDPYYFSRFFKEKTGMTPTGFRKQYM